jgi:hypothetical protein
MGFPRAMAMSLKKALTHCSSIMNIAAVITTLMGHKGGLHAE